ncbi:MAG: PhnE/PtxC family ABC transporter permease, partial [Carnobacterium maltaromaticum]
ANKASKSKRMMQVFWAVIIIITIFQIVTMDYGDNIDYVVATKEFFTNLGKMFFQPELVHFSLATILYNMLVTIGLAFVSTVFSMLISFFLALASATNLGNKHVSQVIKFFVSFLRSVPTILWVLIFSITIGLGSEAAILGIATHSIAYLVKAYAESFEEISKDTVEALTTAGASYWQIVFQSILPAVIDKLLSWSFLRFEINFTVAVVVGAAAASGGIGFELANASGHYANIYEVGFIVWLILIVSAVIEYLSISLNDKIQQSEKSQKKAKKSKKIKV